MIRVSTIVAQELGGASAIHNRKAHRSVIEEISRGQAASSNRLRKVWPQCVRYLLKMSIAQVPEHEQRFFVRNETVIEAYVIDHGAIRLHNIRPSIVIVVKELGSHSAQ